MLVDYKLLQALMMLFVILDPIGNAPLFFMFTSDLPEGERRRTIMMSVVVASFILLCFAVAGDLLFDFFGLTLYDFEIAGGTVLFIYAVLGLLGKMEVEEVATESLAVVPLATPLLAGPGAITTVIYIKQAMGFAYAFTSIAFNSIVALILLLNGERLLRLLGRNGAVALSKIMAMILAGIAVAIIREGLVGLAAALKAA